VSLGFNWDGFTRHADITVRNRDLRRFDGTHNKKVILQIAVFSRLEAQDAVLQGQTFGLEC
jgi:hypothetical protein